jgi:hypothetical protein
MTLAPATTTDRPVATADAAARAYTNSGIRVLSAIYVVTGIVAVAVGGLLLLRNQSASALLETFWSPLAGGTLLVVNFLGLVTVAGGLSLFAGGLLIAWLEGRQPQG